MLVQLYILIYFEHMYNAVIVFEKRAFYNTDYV